jgi:hypothetical protein
MLALLPRTGACDCPARREGGGVAESSRERSCVCQAALNAPCDACVLTPRPYIAAGIEQTSSGTRNTRDPTKHTFERADRLEGLKPVVFRAARRRRAPPIGRRAKGRWRGSTRIAACVSRGRARWWRAARRVAVRQPHVEVRCRRARACAAAPAAEKSHSTPRCRRPRRRRLCSRRHWRSR